MASRFLRRRNFLIKPGNQLRLTMMLVLSFLIYSAILGFIIFYPLSSEFSAAASFEEQARLSSQVLQLHARLWPAVVVVAFLVAIQVILVSHRFFGPVYRFEVAIDEFLRGEFTRRIKLRKHDNLKEMEELMNELADYLQRADERSIAFRGGAEKRLASALDELAHNGEGGTGRARDIIRDVLAELRGAEDIFRGGAGRAGRG